MRSTASVLSNVVAGAIAGAAGTVALNMATYMDQAVRGRPASSTPSDAVGRAASRLGLTGLATGNSSAKADNRRTGTGALLGYAVGVGFGAAYGAVRALGARVPTPLAALLLGAGAMAGADLPLVAAGITDPRSWGKVGWAEDVVPHLAYGAVAATVFARSA